MNTVAVLLIEDDEADAVLIRKYLALSGNASFEVTHADTLARVSRFLKAEHSIS